MRLKMISPVIWALLVSQVASRPQQADAEHRTSQVTKLPDEDARSRLEPQNDRELKDYMDQSLRTVATQLLNVSVPEATAEPKDASIKPKLGLLIRKPDRTIPPAQESFTTVHINGMELVKDVNPDLTPAGRPSNSKYNYFEVSHPGQAMAMTDEDLEREVSATRYPSYKTQQTTTGGLSTWILLNPPSSSTPKSTELNATQGTSPKAPSSSVSAETIVTSSKQVVKTTSPTQKPSSQKSTKPQSPKKTTQKVEKTTTSSETVTPRFEAITSRFSPTSGPSSTSPKVNEDPTTARSTTKKIAPTKNVTKAKSTTVRATTILTKTTMKVAKPQTRPSKLPVTRKTTTPKPEVKTVNSTSKVEKVTFKPVQMITTPKSVVEFISKPVFSAKVQGSIKTDNKPSSPSVESTPKPNNVLKLHLKKPVDTPTTIQIDPIKVSAPVLTIEKLGDLEEPEDEKASSLEPVTLPNSQIDVKFDFNPDSTTTETSPETTTTKRPKSSSKRKKHKTRRRRPSTTPSTIATSPNTSAPAEESSSQDPETSSAPTADTSLQESKIVGDANTKNKKKQVAKPITTQIYNFISREVMPSVGVMSLVGLGLGLASYFLYPFGGAIARRNYEVEPNYKYNLDEYGGNYGQREEEVFTKVLQGMNPNDGKYGGIKDFEKNYYRYQTYDGGYTDTTRRADPRFPTSSVPVYRPEKKPLPYDLKYRSTGFKYSDPSTTPSYYERPKGSDFVEANIDRQFVVGSIPKEYSPEEKKKLRISTSTEAAGVDFEKQIAQSLHFGPNQNVDQSYNQPDAQPLKSDHYEDIEIAPAAVAVEHGPRSLSEGKKRMKRESVIQLIPSRSEIEKEERELEDEEPLSNEILDIIDSAFPGGMVDVKEKKKVETMKKKQENQGKKGVTDRDDEKLTTTVRTQGSQASGTEGEESATKTPETTPAESTSSSTIPSTESGLESSSAGTDPDVQTFPSTTEAPHESFNIFNFVKRVAEVKFRLGLTILKHASESFARYLGQVQKRINGDE